MSKVGQWIMEMEEDATCMTADEFSKKHGSNCMDVFERIQGEMADAFGDDFPSDTQIDAMYQEWQASHGGQHQ